MKHTTNCLSVLPTSVLKAMLLGYQTLQRSVADSISEIEAELRGENGASSPSPSTSTSPSLPLPRKRKFSAATRRRMAESQRARWAARKAEKTDTETMKRAASPKSRLKRRRVN